jgi:hypothetical protein
MRIWIIARKSNLGAGSPALKFRRFITVTFTACCQLVFAAGLSRHPKPRIKGHLTNRLLGKDRLSVAILARNFRRQQFNWYTEPFGGFFAILEYAHVDRRTFS